MTTFTATFSNGITKTRSSWHPYRYAVALVHKTTGEMANVKFTASDKPTADWTGIAATHRAGGWLSQQKADRLNAMAAAEKQQWNIEIVPVVKEPQS